MTDNHTKHNLKARHGANSSLNDMNLSLGDRHSQATKHGLNNKVKFSVVTPVITHFFQQAINTLYGNTSNTQTSQRKVIDTTTPDDNEVISISSHDLSDIACDIESAATVISDIGKLLALIHYEKIDTNTAISMARLTHDTTVTWDDLLQRQVSSIKETLAMTRYGKEGSQ